MDCNQSKICAMDPAEQIRRLGGRTESAVVMVDLSSCGQARDAEDFRRLMPTLKQFTHMRELRLSFFVDDDVMTELLPLSKLERLELTAARVTNRGLHNLSPMKNLRSLVLARTQVTDEGMRHATSFPALEDLDVSITSVADDGLRHLASITQLRRLDISYLKGVTDKGVNSIKQLENLETLWAYGTGITDVGLQQLRELSKLKELRVELTAVTESAVRAFARSRPEVLVRSDFGDFRGAMEDK